MNMASKRTLTVVAGVGAAALAIAGVAIAQNHEANENRIIGEHSERDIPLDQVPQAAMNAARAQLASIRNAEQVNQERKHVVVGKRVAVRLNPGGRRRDTKKKKLKLR